MKKSELLFATHNAHKVEEIKGLIGHQFELKSLSDMGFKGEVPEDQDTLEGNAEQKAKFVFDVYHVPCFADDTGLEVTALKGAPGVYSARYAGCSGTMAEQSLANMKKLLTVLQGEKDRTAQFRTVVCYFDGHQSFFFEGVVKGIIEEMPRGDQGFGYDPIFCPEGFPQTFAEMPLDQKNTISHRSRAFLQFQSFLAQRYV